MTDSEFDIILLKKKEDLYVYLNTFSKKMLVYKDISELEKLYKDHERLVTSICKLSPETKQQVASKTVILSMSYYYLEVHQHIIDTEKCLIKLKEEI